MQIPIYHNVLGGTIDPVNYFNLIRGKCGFLLESADIIEKYGDKSIGCVAPSLRVIIKDGKFTVEALTAMGKKMLSSLKNSFSFATELKITEDKILGVMKRENELKDEESRLKEKNIFDVLRVIALKFTREINLPVLTSGLFGMISYDAIDYFERLPEQEPIQNETPDMEFYYADEMFVIDHLEKKTYLIANSQETLKKYEEAFHKTNGHKTPEANNKNKVSCTISDEEYKKLVVKMKDHIAAGDVFQCVISRTFIVKTEESPLDIYNRLKNINPGPYMFYFENESYFLLGSSPETCLKVSGEPKIAEIKPIAGTFPRGRKNGEIDSELDARYEMDLMLNEKELAEHCMLLDLARNDIAKVSETGTRKTPEFLKIEKFSHVQHLVSRVTGILKPELDALHAYVATMNMGTLTGAPKIKAMELIRKYEKDKREFYGGTVGYLAPNGEFDSCIVIRSILIKDGIASVRAGAGIVYDSDPEKETEETKKKAEACLDALGVKI